MAEFSVVEGFERTSEYLDALQAAADECRDALGFFPRSVYRESARNGDLYVLLCTSGVTATYAGHLLFSCRYPRAHILQVFVLPSHRRGGYASELLRKLTLSLTTQGFIAIYARVAEDLREANAFWERQSFYVQRRVQGGASRSRQILIRAHELPSPQLVPPSGISNANPLGLSLPVSDDAPLFLLDLNVLFDVMPRRLRHDMTASLIQAERVNACRLAISDEIIRELKRSATERRTDPMTAFISLFPSFPLANSATHVDLLQSLAKVVFPERALSDADESDLRHLATAIVNDITGFITNDKAILAASSRIRTKYGVQVISPDALEVDLEFAAQGISFDVTSDSTLRLSVVTPDDESSVRAFLSAVGIARDRIPTVWLPAQAQGKFSARMVVWSGANVLGYLTWSNRSLISELAVARVAMDESNPQSRDVGRILLMHLIETLAATGPRQVSLECPPNQSVLREMALGMGFGGAGSGSPLTKIILGRVMTRGTWVMCATQIASVGGLRLPGAIPGYEHADQQVAVFTPNGNKIFVSLDVLETLLSPALLCLPRRPAVIAPIQRMYSELLLGNSRQSMLLPRGSARAHPDQHYIAGPSTVSKFKRGTLIFFYESARHQGRGEVVALARVRQAYRQHSTELIGSLEKSVLTAKCLPEIGVSKMKTVVAFDNVFHLPRAVPLSSLKRIGCGRPNDLISTRAISDDQLEAILLEAFSNGQ